MAASADGSAGPGGTQDIGMSERERQELGADLMQRTFNQAGEKAVLLSLSYDFSHLGVAGVSTIVNFVQGWDGRELGVPGDAREVDATLDYRVPSETSLFQGLWLRLRGAWLDDERTDKNGVDVRVILRYDFPVL